MPKITYFFREKTGIWHAILGFIAGMMLLIPTFGWIITLIFHVVYFTYQALEMEKEVETTKNMVEYLIGLSLSLPFIIR